MNKISDKKKEVLRNIIILTALLLVAGVLMILFPDKQPNMVRNVGDFLIEMLFILPAVMILMGLFAVWVPKEIIEKYLGNTSGIKGLLFSFVLGALPTGPLYVAFPLASGLYKKGASITNLVVFLSAWACIKIPQELVELQFLGAKFMIVRLLLTIVLVTIMAIIINKLMINAGKCPVPGPEHNPDTTLPVYAPLSPNGHTPIGKNQENRKEKPVMEIFDLRKIKAYPYEERDKNVFFKSKQFKARIIKLDAGKSMPACEMQSFVVFYVIEGSAELQVNDDIHNIKEGMCMITGPAILSLKTKKGVLIAGFQINE